MCSSVIEAISSSFVKYYTGVDYTLWKDIYFSLARYEIMYKYVKCPTHIRNFLVNVCIGISLFYSVKLKCVMQYKNYFRISFIDPHVNTTIFEKIDFNQDQKGTDFGDLTKTLMRRFCFETSWNTYSDANIINYELQNHYFEFCWLSGILLTVDWLEICTRCCVLITVPVTDPPSCKS